MRRSAITYGALLLVLAMMVACSATPAETTSTTTATQTTAATTTAATTATSATTTAATTTSTTKPEPEPPAEAAELVWIFEYENEKFGPQSLAMHPDGELVTVGAYMATYTQRLFDGELARVDTEYRHSVDSLVFSSDGRYLVAGLSSFGVVVKDFTGETDPLQLHSGYNNFVAYAADTATLATGNRNAAIWLWSLPDGGQIIELPDTERGYLWSLAFHPSGQQIASLQWRDDGVIQIWSVEDKEIIQTLLPNILVGSTDQAISYSPGGTWFGACFTEDWKHKIRIFDTTDYALAIEIPLEKRPNAIAFSPDEQMIAVASIHAPTTIWSTATGELLYTLDQTDIGTTDGSKTLAFTPDGGHLCVVRNRGNLELWRLPGAEPLPEPLIDLYQPVPIPGDVLFDTGSAELKTEADAVLEELAQDIHAALPAAKLTFVGHTDSRGDASSNMKLSVDRATSVKNWFEAWANDNGADGWTFATEGKGETELNTPDVDGDGNFREEAGRVNRRVEIVIDPAG